MEPKELLAKIKQQIPEFDAEQSNSGWSWTFRCAEQETDSCGSLIECFIDFAAKNVLFLDEAQGLMDDEDF